MDLHSEAGIIAALSDEQVIARRIRQECMRRGWTWAHLAKATETATLRDGTTRAISYDVVRRAAHAERILWKNREPIAAALDTDWLDLSNRKKLVAEVTIPVNHITAPYPRRAPISDAPSQVTVTKSKGLFNRFWIWLTRGR